MDETALIDDDDDDNNESAICRFSEFSLLCYVKPPCSVCGPSPSAFPTLVSRLLDRDPLQTAPCFVELVDGSRRAAGKK